MKPVEPNYHDRHRSSLERMIRDNKITLKDIKDFFEEPSNNYCSDWMLNPQYPKKVLTAMDLIDLYLPVSKD